MTLEQALVEIRELGDFFAVAVAERTGKSIDDSSPLMNGLVAYYQLDLKGVSESCDKAVDMVMKVVYESAVEKLNSISKGETE
jgi:CRISPR/Cas system type I-B associated protein Csh2 (Cas7 group RAMP superfamily)